MTETIPGWSDERVDLLSRLWQDGLSASQIATQLGGVTRNAVIGKIHRLGLSGRVAKGTDGALPRRKPTREIQAEENTAQGIPVGAAAPEDILAQETGARLAQETGAREIPVQEMDPREVRADGTEAASVEAMDIAATGVAAMQPRPSAMRDAADSPAAPAPIARLEAVALATSRRVTIMDLRESMCRWPLGDPTSPDFHYCGDRSITGLPYCTHHAQIAYQPAAERRRDRRVGGFR